MRKNPFTVLLVPLVLACILAVLIILDKQNSSTQTQNPETGENGLVSSMVTPAPDPTTAPTPISTITPTSAPTATPSPTPMATAAPTAAPSTETTNSPEVVEEATPESTEVKYEALFTQQGDHYTLVADSISKYFVVVDNEDHSIRQTEFTYHPKLEETQLNSIGPVWGYRNGQFVFIAQNQIVSSDGQTETILKTFEGEDVSYDTQINLLLQSENRIVSGFNNTLLVVIDCRTLTVETYIESYTPEFFLFTDEFLCFSHRKRIPAGPYYHYLYSAKEGNAQLLASIGEIDEYVLDNATVIIKSNGETFQIDLETNTLTASAPMDRERTLYFPIYSDSMIDGLSEMKYIHYNDPEEPVHSIALPDFLEAECYYNTYYNLAMFSLFMKDNAKSAQLPNGVFGSFAAIDASIFPLEDEKYPLTASVKEKLFTGATNLGNGEVFLLEKIETVKNESVPFEMVYAWIPIEGGTKAYQFYVYVPTGEDYTIYWKMVKQFLHVE